MLHVPKLFTNLVYIKKLTQDLGSNAIFYLTVYFTTKIWGRWLDLLRNKTGYTTLRHQANHLYLFFLSTTIKEKSSFIIAGLDIHHLGLLRSCFFLCKKLNVESFHCEVCELAKHKCSTFSIINKRSSEPFHLIHSDMCGPSLVFNISEAH